MPTSFDNNHPLSFFGSVSPGAQNSKGSRGSNDSDIKPRKQDRDRNKRKILKEPRSEPRSLRQQSLRQQIIGSQRSSPQRSPARYQHHDDEEEQDHDGNHDGNENEVNGDGEVDGNNDNDDYLQSRPRAAKPAGKIGPKLLKKIKEVEDSAQEQIQRLEKAAGDEISRLRNEITELKKREKEILEQKDREFQEEIERVKREVQREMREKRRNRGSDGEGILSSSADFQSAQSAPSEDDKVDPAAFVQSLFSNRNKNMNNDQTQGSSSSSSASSAQEDDNDDDDQNLNQESNSPSSNKKLTKHLKKKLKLAQQQLRQLTECRTQFSTVKQSVMKECGRENGEGLSPTSPHGRNGESVNLANWFSATLEDFALLALAMKSERDEWRSMAEESVAELDKKIVDEEKIADALGKKLGREGLSIPNSKTTSKSSASSAGSGIASKVKTRAAKEQTIKELHSLCAQKTTDLAQMVSENEFLRVRLEELEMEMEGMGGMQDARDANEQQNNQVQNKRSETGGSAGGSSLDEGHTNSNAAGKNVVNKHNANNGNVNKSPEDTKIQNALARLEGLRGRVNAQGSGTGTNGGGGGMSNYFMMGMGMNALARREIPEDIEDQDGENSDNFAPHANGLMTSADNFYSAASAESWSGFPSGSEAEGGFVDEESISPIQLQQQSQHHYQQPDNEQSKHQQSQSTYQQRRLDHQQRRGVGIANKPRESVFGGVKRREEHGEDPF